MNRIVTPPGGTRRLRAEYAGMLKERGYVCIVSMSSFNGEKGQFDRTNYPAAKARIIRFTKALAPENAAKGITMNAITPNTWDTATVAEVPDRTPQKIVDAKLVEPLGQPADIAREMTFSVNVESDLITGATLNVNGCGYMQ